MSIMRLSHTFREFSSAYADLGTFLPLVLGLVVVADMSPVGLLFGFGIFAIGTGLYYQRPIPVQPMKAVAAMGIAGIAGPEVLIATGLLLGVTLLILSQTQSIGWLKGLIPKTVLFGMRVALAVSLVAMTSQFADVSFGPVAVLVGLLILLQFSPIRSISCLIVLVFGWVWLGNPVNAADLTFELSFPSLVLPSADAMLRSLELTFLPQLALTLTNALILTSVISQEYFPDRSSQLNEKRFALTSGLANVVLAPFGAMPMCHGAGGLSAHYGLGARSGVSIIIFGLSCLLLALCFGSQASSVLALIPHEVIVTLVLYAAWVLADPPKILSVKPSCQCIILIMVPISLSAGLVAALLSGVALEWALSKSWKPHEA
jgi:SulP family sulfate permease